MTSQSSDSTASAEELDLLQPSEAEIEEWAARERKRREQWLSGPTAEEKAVWAWRERERRLTERESFRDPPSFRSASRLVQRSVRKVQLSVEGVASLLFNRSLSDTTDQLVRAGREWEAEVTSQPPGRRRIPPDEPAQASRSPAVVEPEQATRPD